MAAFHFAALTSHTLPFALSAGVNLVACALLGGYFLLRSRRGSAIRLFAIYNLCAAGWSLFYLLWQLSDSAVAATLYTRLLMAFATLLPLLYFGFTLRFLKRAVPAIRIRIIGLLFVGFCLLSLFTPLIVGDITPRGGFAFWPVAGLLLTPLLLLWFGVVIATLLLLARAALQATTRRQRGQMLALLLGNIIAYAGGATNFFLWYDIPILPWGNSATLAVPLATLYAVAAYRLFDLRLFIKKTLIYSGLLAFVLLVYGLVAAVAASVVGIGGRPSWRYLLLSAASSIVPGLAFERMKDVVNALLDRTLFRRQREQQGILKALAEELNRTWELGEAMGVVLTRLTHTFGLRRAVAILNGGATVTPSNSGPPKSHIWQVGYSGAHRLSEENLQPLYEYLRIGDKDDRTKWKDNTLGPLPRARLSWEVDYAEREIQRHPTRFNGEYLRQHALRKAAARKLARMDAEIAVPLRLEGQIIGLLLLGDRARGELFNSEELMLLDLVASQTTSAIQKANLLAGDRMKEEFVEVAAHELLTPIAAMKGYLDLVLDGKESSLDAEARRFLMNARTSVKRLSTMSADLLSVSRIEGGRMTFQPEAVDLIALVTDALAQLVFTAKDKGLELRFDPPRRIPALYADPERTMQVLINLLSNAIKYTPRGYVEVTIEARMAVHMVRISVRDTGLGMTPEQRGKLFQKFSRIATPETASIAGTGLGLYITKSIVEMMGGTITVTSRPGRGSAFIVDLPMVARAMA